MSQLPQVSVIIPCYNASAYIEAALASIRRQGVEDMEIIVVDDGSTDDSIARVKRIAPEAHIVEQANAGPAAARNTGIAASTGRYLVFLDADDLWVDGKLRCQLAAMEADRTIDVCYGGYQLWGSQGEAAPVLAPIAVDLAAVIEPQALAHLLFDCVVWTPAVMVRRSAVIDDLWFDAGFDVGEDYDLWLRLASKYRFARLPTVVALYRDTPGSLTKKLPRLNFEKLVVEAAMERMDPKELRALLPALNQRLAILAHNFGVACYREGRRDDALAALRESLGKRFSLKGWMLLLAGHFRWSYSLAASRLRARHHQGPQG